MQKFDHNTGFQEKRKIFRRKLPKLVENCNHYEQIYAKTCRSWSKKANILPKFSPKLFQKS
jgi:hypothetical protein